MSNENDSFSLANRYRHAAIAYFLYGVVYLSGAIYLAEAGLTERGSGNGWIWFAIGVVFLIVIPWVIRRGIRWFTLAVAGFMALRIAGLVRIMWMDWGAQIPLPWGGATSKGSGAFTFALITLAAMAMLIRAAYVSRDS